MTLHLARAGVFSKVATTHMRDGLLTAIAQARGWIDDLSQHYPRSTHGVSLKRVPVRRRAAAFRRQSKRGPSDVDMLEATYPMRPDSSQVSGRVLLTKSVVHVP